MITSRRIIAVVSTAAISALLVGVGASGATASHFRASGPDFSVTENVATWVVTTAWESGGADNFEGLGGTTEVLSIGSYADVPGSGSGTGVELEVISEVVTDEPLYAQTVETFQGDLSSLADGLYELYIEDCCRVDDIENSVAEDFSQWVRFSKTGSTYLVAPRLTSPIIFAPLSTDGTTTLVSYAAPGATSWTVVSDENYPYYGSGDLPCSSFVGGALEIGSEHCTGGDVYTDIYLPGSFWAFKVAIADDTGRQSVAETLFRVESAPQPYIDEHELSGDGTTASFWAYAPDTLVSSWVIECTNTSDSGDVVSGSGTSIPITVAGFTSLEEYSCVATGTNAVGSGTSPEDDYYVYPPLLDLELQFVKGDIYSGSTALATGLGLDSFSPYSLVMVESGLVLLEGETDEVGEFSDEIVVPVEACSPGRYELRLSAVAEDGDIGTSAWVEIGAGCVVLEIRSSAWPTELAQTGTDSPVPAVAFAALLAGLGALLVTRRRLQLARD